MGNGEQNIGDLDPRDEVEISALGDSASIRITPRGAPPFVVSCRKSTLWSAAQGATVHLASLEGRCSIERLHDQLRLTFAGAGRAGCAILEPRWLVRSLERAADPVSLR
jgi:hypothetical protein